MSQLDLLFCGPWTLSSSRILKDKQPIANGARTPSTPSSKQVQRLSLELAELQSRYDALVKVHEQSTEEYRTRYTKWRDFKRWLFDEEVYNKDRSKERQILETPEEKEKRKRQQYAKILKKRQMLLKVGPDSLGIESDGEFVVGASSFRDIDIFSLNSKAVQRRIRRISTSRCQAKSPTVAPPGLCGRNGDLTQVSHL